MTKTVSALNAATKLELRDVCFAGVTNTLTVNDTTPDVTDKGNFKTANTIGTAIYNFTGGVDGQRISVMINDANTSLDFTTSSLIGNGGVDWNASVGDSFTAVLDNAGKWWCQILESSGSGEVNTARNDGTGDGLAKANDGVVIPFKSLVGGDGIDLSNDINTVTITNTGDAGEVNTASNDGVGEGLAKTKDVFDLPFKSLFGGTNITVSSDADTVTIAANSTVATALSTTGSDVDVSASTPPVEGQILKATAATTATWQDNINITTHLEGNTMFYNPDDLGIYADVAAVLAAIPSGGTTKLINEDDEQICYINQLWPEGADTQYAVSNTLNSLMFRNQNSAVDGIPNVWESTGKAFITPTDISGLKMWLDASFISTMWQSEDRTAQITADSQSLLAWDSKDYATNNHVSFNVKETILSVVPGATTTINLYSALFNEVSVEVGDTVNIQELNLVTGSQNIIGSHTVTSVPSAAQFIISFDSSSSTYDVSTAYYKNVANQPKYKSNAMGVGIPGILFDGNRDFFNGPALALEGQSATIITVATLDDSITGITRNILGRRYGGESIGLRNDTSTVTMRAKYENKVKETTSVYPTYTPRPVVYISRLNATNIYTTISFDADASTTSNGTDFVYDNVPWQVGQNGSTAHTASNGYFKGFIHAIAMYNKELSDKELSDLKLYFNNKYKAEVLTL